MKKNSPEQNSSLNDKIRTEQTSSPDEKIIVRKLTLVSVIGNVLLTAFKMAAGVIGHSGAMVSDAVHSLSDIITTVIAAIGVKLSARSADRNHPYGHERFECIASLFLGMLLGITGFLIGKAGLTSILSGEYKYLTPPSGIALIAAVVSIAVKEAMFWYTRYYARKIRSNAFLADAWHHRSDALSSIGSFIGIGGAMLGFPIMEPLASLVICVFIFKVTFDILKDSLTKLLDTSCSEEFETAVRSFVKSQPGVLGVDSLHTRQFGNRIYIDLEISVRGDQSLEEAHAIAEATHKNVEKEFPDVKHIMIHENPVNTHKVP